MSRSIRFKVHKPVTLTDSPVPSSGLGDANRTPRETDHEALLSFDTEGRQPRQIRDPLSGPPRGRTYTPEIVFAVVLTVIGAVAIALFLRRAPGNPAPEAA